MSEQTYILVRDIDVMVFKTATALKAEVQKEVDEYETMDVIDELVKEEFVNATETDNIVGASSDILSEMGIDADIHVLPVIGG